MGFSICVYLSGLFLSCSGLHVLGPTDPLTVRLGGSLMLPCYTETLIPLEELEVEWMRTDSESLVHLFQDGEIRPESQNQAYSGRASFFTEEIKHGNFSLLLTNITTEDAGVYNCSVHRQDESAQTSVQIKEIERLTVTGGHVISAYAGEAVTLNCSVDSHIPPEKMEEVSWKKVDQDILVLMFKDGEVKTESAHGSYMGRVEFCSLDEISKGNFSLRLKDLRTEDKGLYMCEVFSGEFSANATVEVQQLGFSSMHIGVLFLCTLAFVFPVFLSYHARTYLIKKDYGRTALSVQCVFVISPNVAMFLAFILWGVIEGFFREAATCSALSLLRIVFLFWTAPYLSTFQVHVCRFIKRSAVTLEYAVITTVAFSGLLLNFWHLYQETQKWGIIIFFLVLFTTPLLVLYINIFAQGKNFSYYINQDIFI
ncbi:butyrophilin-like protein 2 isoform X1 [Astyanax mexicanus]|uniref:butyrophilin-like protein 2 isoform X1 n=1 Tax=Astyanax mexicanus TaxID=7994 RepID=UPI0020CB0E80|nr:butyrophilin-like protein 2 isoform X1 [Astyanax mexicanus]